MRLDQLIKYYGIINNIDISFIDDVVIMLRPGDSSMSISKWNVDGLDKPTELQLSEIEADAEYHFNSIKIRNDRDILLRESDWRLLRNLEPSSNINQEWKDYRQALRDIPLHPDFPNVNFPEKPKN